MQAEINKEFGKKTGYISDSLSKTIVEYAKQRDIIEEYSEFYSEKNTRDILNFSAIIRTEDLTTVNGIILMYHKMVRLAEYATNITYNDLISGLNIDVETSNLAYVLAIFGPHEVLKQYEKYRKKYIGLYNRLSPDERKLVDKAIQTGNYAEKYQKYREKFGINGDTGEDVATDDQIKRVVNHQIIEYYMKDRLIYRHSNSLIRIFAPKLDSDGADVLQTVNYYSFEYSVKYMSVSELASFYATLKNKRFEEHDYDKYPELQLLFAQTIRNRIIGGRKADTLNGNEKDSEQYKIQRETELIAICQDYLKEEPLFKTTFVKASDVPKDYATKRVVSSETINNAERRYYGMDKATRAFAFLDLNKLKKLAQKEVLTPEEIEKVNGMFRR